MAIQKKTVQLDASAKIQSILEKTAKNSWKNKTELLGVVEDALNVANSNCRIEVGLRDV